MKNLTKILSSVLIILTIYSCSSSNYGLGKTRFIMPNYAMLYPTKNYHALSISEIRRADKIIEDSIEILYRKKCYDKHPWLKGQYLNADSLGRYYAQYLGKIKEGDTIVSVFFSRKEDVDNFINSAIEWNRDREKRGLEDQKEEVFDMTKEVYQVIGGAGTTWYIVINITKNTIRHFEVNM